MKFGNSEPIDMAKTKMIRKKNGMLRLVARALQRSLSLPSGRTCSRGYKQFDEEEEEEDFEEAINATQLVPEDVKEGQFAVLAANDDKPRRFVISLSCLSHPMFLKLLELAEEEFGFCHEGALAIPCRSSELERVLREL